MNDGINLQTNLQTDPRLLRRVFFNREDLVVAGRFNDGRFAAGPADIQSRYAIASRNADPQSLRILAGKTFPGLFLKRNLFAGLKSHQNAGADGIAIAELGTGGRCIVASDQPKSKTTVAGKPADFVAVKLESRRIERHQSDVLPAIFIKINQRKRPCVGDVIGPADQRHIGKIFAPPQEHAVAFIAAERIAGEFEFGNRLTRVGLHRNHHFVDIPLIFP